MPSEMGWRRRAVVSMTFSDTPDDSACEKASEAAVMNVRTRYVIVFLAWKAE